MPRRIAKTAALLPLFVLWFAPAAAQTIGQGQPTGIAWWRVAGALVLCLGLAVAAAFALRARMGEAGKPFFRASSERRLELRETLRIGSNTSVALVRCDAREFLVVTAPQGIAVHALPHSAGEPT